MHCIWTLYPVFSWICFRLSVKGIFVSNFVLQDLARKWADVKNLVPQRDQTLNVELQKQQSRSTTRWRVVFLSVIFLNAFPLETFPDNESLRRQFAEKANQIGPWIEKQLDSVTSIAMSMQVCERGI